mmetsp:Transcript_11640/g.35541  ORF Transcript_11640/g.35541 Transcript_11640/m.35541 type:complete len:140 (+) Transcript_11640:93-512(+)|eukprot:CAMPEP_0198727432 /NCGR_PEP_ID=MMETSP1475-20131203/4166_1 /TAXON_ID= ORGANISM="Unidentified sp., Strain CCMP1999" /NCGR_SAMPLE_ID=MMETSP1475 /ASSEMBLY_ACC=CAM_ASM_001111 /LENGTH=139 /DNA_ID=CAMNT_0044489467 /DNA_START=107 /DNA_END=526 /DNA_ORIENTATION=+
MAFVVSGSSFVGSGASVSRASCRVQRRVAVSRRTVRAQAEKEEESKPLSTLSKEEQAEKDKIMAELQQEINVSKEIAPNNRNLGATRDADGKANIWAVEPPVEVSDRKNKAIIVAVVVAVILAGITILPKLPLVSPDVY